MLLKKKYLIISALIIFWVVVIGWGMLKTGLKLTKEKSSPAKTNKTEISPEQELPAEQVKPPETPTVSTETKPSPILARTLKIKRADFNDLLPVMGTIKGKTEIELRFEINGSIKKIYFREGEKIKKGDLIACLDPKDAQLKTTYAKNKFNSTQAAYHSAEKKLEVHRKLYEVGAIIKSKLEEVELETESARYQVETARSEMDLALNELNKTYIYAVKDGVMGPREAEEGEFVTSQDKAGSLLEISEVLVEVGIVERDIDKIRLGQKAKVYVDAYPNIAFEGTLDSIFPIVEGKSRTLTAKIKVSNPQGLLLPGMFSRAEIFISELKDALLVPTTALIQAGPGITLVPVIPTESLVIDKEEVKTGIVNLRQVTIGYITSDYAQINEGINEDDLIVIEAQGELKDNSLVRITAIEEMSF